MGKYNESSPALWFWSYSQMGKNELLIQLSNEMTDRTIEQNRLST